MDSVVQIFISYAREDQEKAREIHRRLVDRGYKPWLDEEELLPGQDFRIIIEKSLTTSDFVIVCLSKTSVVKRSFFQRELKQALDRLKEMRPEDIFLIPARIDDCAMPDELKDRHWVDLFDDRGWEKLFKAIEIELRNRGKVSPPRAEPPGPAPPKPQSPPASKPPESEIAPIAADGGIF